MASGGLGRVYADGEVLIRQGEVGDCMYVIQEGEADVFVERQGEEVFLRRAGRNEILGEMAIFEREVRSATVRAHGEVRALTVDKRTFMQRINEDPSLAFRIVQMMSHRIRELSAEIAKLRS